jgi:hypothetical protein
VELSARKAYSATETPGLPLHHEDKVAALIEERFRDELLA